MGKAVVPNGMRTSVRPYILISRSVKKRAMAKLIGIIFGTYMIYYLLTDELTSK